MVEISSHLIVQELDHTNSGKLSASHLLDISQIQHQRGQMKVQAVRENKFSRANTTIREMHAEQHLTWQLLC